MINLGLARISRLLASTPIPWKAVHIAGTNGKGSVASIISSILHASGVSVGRFNSPHLIDRWDCISINQQTVPKSVFLQVERFVKERNEAQKIEASEFELLTATAFEIFTGAKVEIGVVECGLGGRLDATNVLKANEVLCSVITKVGMDHEALLGDSPVKIAREKAGILKTGVPFVIDRTNLLEVLMTVDEIAKDVGAIYRADTLPLIVKKQISTAPGKVPLPNVTGATVDTSRWPIHQQQNLETALLACCAILKDYNTTRKLRNAKTFESDGSFGPEQLSAMVKGQNSWPGRLQLVDTSKITGNEKLVLLDGAHNKQAAEALSNHVDSTCRLQGPVVWVIAMSKGKSVKDLISTLVRHGDEVVVTNFGPVDGMPWVRCEDWYRLEQSIRRMTRDRIRVHSTPRPWHALRIASEIAGDQRQVIVCGSLYLVGDVLNVLRDKPPEELDGPKWNSWVEEQERKFEKRYQGVFD